MSNDRFRANIAKRVERAKQKTELFYQKVTLEIYSRIVLKSPVDTGRFRANWNVGNRAVDNSTNEGTDPTGSASIASASTILAATKINGQTIFVTNSLPYAARLEYEGWSKQAPVGMVRVTLAELSSVVNGIAYEVRNT